MVINSKIYKSKYPNTIWWIMACIMSKLWKNPNSNKPLMLLNMAYTYMESCFSHMAYQGFVYHAWQSGYSLTRKINHHYTYSKVTYSVILIVHYGNTSITWNMNANFKIQIQIQIVWDFSRFSLPYKSFYYYVNFLYCLC